VGLDDRRPFGHTGVARHRCPPWGYGIDATSHTMPHRGVSCHLSYDVVPSFTKNLPQKASPHPGPPGLASTSKPRAGARIPRPAAHHAKTWTSSATAVGWPWTLGPGVSTQSPGPEGQGNGRQGPPRGGPGARRWPSPRPPRASPAACGPKGLEGSIARGRRCVGGLGAGGTRGGAWGDAVSRAHRAPGGLGVRPAQG
jgi:hypothetical protein